MDCHRIHHPALNNKQTERDNKMSNMIAKLPTSSTENAKNLDGDKERVSSYNLIGVSAEGIPIEIIDCRVWMGRSTSASVVYASVWIRDKAKARWYSGYGKAGGYGYHKESAAIAHAIDSAGVEFYGSAYAQSEEVDYSERCYIAGVGQSAMDQAFFAIASALGYDASKCIIV